MIGSVRRTAVRLLLGAVVATTGTLSYTSSAIAQVPGDNGDVKVHDSATPETDQRNDPKVCRFYLVGFNFDANQMVAWTINQQPPTGTDQVEQGVLQTDESGFGRTDDMTLPKGHYKLDWVAVGSQGAGKFKVFEVTCDSPTASPSPSGSASPSPGPTASSTAAPPQKPGVPTKFPAGYANASDARTFPLGTVIGLTGLVLFLAGAATLVGTARRRDRHGA